MILFKEIDENNLEYRIEFKTMDECAYIVKAFVSPDEEGLYIEKKFKIFPLHRSETETALWEISEELDEDEFIARCEETDEELKNFELFKLFVKNSVSSRFPKEGEEYP